MMTGYTALLKNMIALWLGFVTTVLAACPFPHDPNSPAPLFADTKSALCPTDASENGGPQGRLVRGGCLEHFTYVFAEDQGRRISPPEALPDRVTAFHRRSGVDVELRIETHSTDRCIKDQAGRQIDDSATRLYDVYAWTSDKGWFNLCGDETYVPERETCEGESKALAGKAIAVPGYWNDKGEHSLVTKNNQSVFTLACISGVAAKCVHWGYVPWATYPPGSSSDTGTKLAGYHSACVHAARARYLDADKSFTCPNNVIDTFDKLGIRSPEHDPTFAFEAAWGAEGLICMNRPRYKGCEEITSRQKTGSLSPCSKAEYNVNDAWPAGALIMNSSKPQDSPSGQCPVTAKECRPAGQKKAR